jgi:hypothetical protein
LKVAEIGFSAICVRKILMLSFLLTSRDFAAAIGQLKIAEIGFSAICVRKKLM